MLVGKVQENKVISHKWRLHLYFYWHERDDPKIMAKYQSALRLIAKTLAKPARLELFKPSLAQLPTPAATPVPQTVCKDRRHNHH